MSNPDVKDEAGDRAMLIDPQAWALAAKTVHDDQPLWVWVADASGETLVKLQAFLTAYLAAATTAKDKNLAEVAYEPQFSTDWEREDYRRRKLGLPGLGPRVLVQPEAQLRLSGTEDAGVRALVEAIEPFAALARERYPEEGGAPSFIDIMTDAGMSDELELRTNTGPSDHTELLYGVDFRRAAAAVKPFRRT